MVMLGGAIGDGALVIRGVALAPYLKTDAAVAPTLDAASDLAAAFHKRRPRGVGGRRGRARASAEPAVGPLPDTLRRLAGPSAYAPRALDVEVVAPCARGGP